MRFALHAPPSSACVCRALYGGMQSLVDASVSRAEFAKQSWDGSQYMLSPAGDWDGDPPLEASRGRLMLRPSGVCVDDAGDKLVTSGTNEVAASCAR